MMGCNIQYKTLHFLTPKWFLRVQKIKLRFYYLFIFAGTNKNLSAVSVKCDIQMIEWPTTITQKVTGLWYTKDI